MKESNFCIVTRNNKNLRRIMQHFQDDLTRTCQEVLKIESDARRASVLGVSISKKFQELQEELSEWTQLTTEVVNRSKELGERLDIMQQAESDRRLYQLVAEYSTPAMAYLDKNDEEATEKNSAESAEASQVVIIPETQQNKSLLLFDGTDGTPDLDVHDSQAQVMKQFRHSTPQGQSAAERDLDDFIDGDYDWPSDPEWDKAL